MSQTYKEILQRRDTRDEGTALYFRLGHKMFRLREDPTAPGQPIIELADAQAPLQFLAIGHE